MRLFLASASPRRAELLRQVGVKFERVVPQIDETRTAGEQPEDFVKRLASEKALAGYEMASAQSFTGPCFVLGADTIVVHGDRIFGKPVDREDYRSMLRQLSGSSHMVHTAVALYSNAGTPRLLTAGSASQVGFRPVSDTEIENYWASGEPRDKAGGYGIQGIGALFVETLRGSYSGVVGLPLCETGRLLASAGISTALQGNTDTIE